MKRDFIDHHCHLLPSVDDGSTDHQESLAMARILADFGFSAVHCTPHRIKGCYDNDPEKVRQGVRYLQRRIFEEGIDLRLIPGTEHYLDEFLLDMLPDALTTGAAQYLLVEAPFTSAGQIVPSLLTGIQSRGLVPLVAHPERCSVFEPAKPAGLRGAFSFLRAGQQTEDMDGSLMFRLRDAGCKFQGNIGSFAGLYGSEVKQRALLFLKNGLYSCIGSDAHRSENLASLLATGFQTVAGAVGEEEACRLFSGAALRG
jgi:protein-tyrosine phosphatase